MHLLMHLPDIAIMTDFLIGTSGWYYDHWEGPFYPPGLARAGRLTFYCQHFNTVELNSTFYHLPRAKTSAHWFNDTPVTFRFAIKASRVITHMKKLKDPQRSLHALFTAIAPLQPKCSAILFQLPPSLLPDYPLLKDFISLLPKTWCHALEFRHLGWYSDRILALLEKYAITLCIHDHNRIPSPVIATSRTVYYRFHGTDGHYQGDYSKDFLEQKAMEIRSFIQQGHQVFCYFNNDFNCLAVKNAKELMSLLNE